MVQFASSASAPSTTASAEDRAADKRQEILAAASHLFRSKGLHATGMMDGDFRKQVESQLPLGRIGQPRDIAPAAVFLASEDGGWITGETLRVSGGLY